MDIFPNPSEGKFTVHFGSLGADDIIIKVSTIDGRSVQKVRQENIAHNHCTVDLSHLDASPYILTVETLRGSISQTILIE